MTERLFVSILDEAESQKRRRPLFEGFRDNGEADIRDIRDIVAFFGDL